MTRARFQGYASPNYTPVPDELFDEQLPDLSGAEVKVLLYIIRRTFGFKKESDNISLNQLLSGVTTRSGEQLDRGTGLSRSTLMTALKGLAQRNLIIVQQRSSAEKGNEATNYRLNLLYRPGSKIERGEAENRTSLVRKSNAQETARQEREIPLRNSRANAGERAQDGQIPVHTGQEQPEGSTSHAGIRGRGDDEVVPTSLRNSKDQFSSLAAVLQQRRGMDHVLTPPASQSLTSSTPTPQLAACIAEIAHDLGDQRHLRANVTQALHLLQRSGVPEALFVARLYEAMAITKDRRRGTSGAPTQPVAKPMAYFWTVVRDLLGLRDLNLKATTAPEVPHGPTGQGREEEWTNGQLGGETSGRPDPPRSGDYG